MIGRVIWCVSLFGLALCVSAAQIDRQARFDPEYSVLVPKPFRGFSQQHLVRAALASDAPHLALAETRQLVRVRPLPAEHLTALALAASTSGDEETAIRALEAAASRGWRDPVAQIAVVEASLLNQDYDMAAQRLVALWSVGENKERLYVFTARMFETAAGRSAFVKVMPTSPRWLRNFKTGAGPGVDAETLAQVIALAQARSAD